MPKLEVVPATVGCRPLRGLAGEHNVDYSSSYPGMREIGCHTGLAGAQEHCAVSVVRPIARLAPPNGVLTRQEFVEGMW